MALVLHPQLQHTLSLEADETHVFKTTSSKRLNHPSIYSMWSISGGSTQAITTIMKCLLFLCQSSLAIGIHYHQYLIGHTAWVMLLQVNKMTSLSENSTSYKTMSCVGFSDLRPKTLPFFMVLVNFSYIPNLSTMREPDRCEYVLMTNLKMTVHW